ncbi:MAG: hypothetical protein K0U64_03920 [Actinomycetia bacterium]|nr:hypothetical protein [Actinomycetes bacterium]
MAKKEDSGEALGTPGVTGSEAWGIMNRIIAAIVIYGGLGFLIGMIFDAQTVGLALGTLLGVGLATYTTMVRVSSLSDSALPVGQNRSGTSWSNKMTQVRMRNARENTE